MLLEAEGLGVAVGEGAAVGALFYCGVSFPGAVAAGLVSEVGDFQFAGFGDWVDIQVAFFRPLTLISSRKSFGSPHADCRLILISGSTPLFTV